MSTKNIFMLAVTAIVLLSCAKERLVQEPGNLVPKTVQENPALPSITVNGAKLHSEAYGHPDSTLVVFIHGGPGSDYRGLLNGKQLANHGYRVVFYDQRGSGLSQRFSARSYTDAGTGALDLMYADLAGVIAHYRTSPGQKVYLVGHSWGAILATAYAGRYPGAVQGLVVAEPGGLNWPDIRSYVKASRSFGLWSEMLNDVSYLDQFLTASQNQHQVLDYKQAMLAARNDITGEDNTQPGSFWRPGAVVNAAFFNIGKQYEPDFSTGIGNFHPPVLFLYSERNKAYPLSWAQKISAAYYHVQVKQISGTGHAGIFSDNQAWTNSTLPLILGYFSSL
ncbi:MAG TPA: alpha/beta hydrolase [Chitinophagaceae bacterium]